MRGGRIVGFCCRCGGHGLGVSDFGTVMVGGFQLGGYWGLAFGVYLLIIVNRD